MHRNRTVSQRHKRLEFKDEKHRRRVEQRLREAVFIYGTRDWKSVAHYVGSDATSFSCMVYYRVHMETEPQPPVEMSNARIRSTLHAFTRSTNHVFMWNKALDAQLRELVLDCSQDTRIPFKRIAEEIGGGVTAQQCNIRWRDHVDPALSEYRIDAWSAEESARLQLLHELRVPPRSISRQLKRTHQSCRSQLLCLSKQEAVRPAVHSAAAAQQTGLPAKASAEATQRAARIKS